MNQDNKNDCIESIDVVREQDGKTHVLGRTLVKSYFDSSFDNTILYHIVHDSSTKKILEDNTFMERSKYKIFDKTKAVFTFAYRSFISELNFTARNEKKETHLYKNILESFQNANSDKYYERHDYGNKSPTEFVRAWLERRKLRYRTADSVK